MLNKYCLVFLLYNISPVVNANLDQLLSDLSFSQQDKEKVLQGKLVTTQIEESEEP